MHSFWCLPSRSVPFRFRVPFRSVPFRSLVGFHTRRSSLSLSPLPKPRLLCLLLCLRGLSPEVRCVYAACMYFPLSLAPAFLLPRLGESSFQSAQASVHSDVSVFIRVVIIVIFLLVLVVFSFLFLPSVSLFLAVLLGSLTPVLFAVLYPVSRCTIVAQH